MKKEDVAYGNQPSSYDKTPQGMAELWAKELEAAGKELKIFKEKSKVVVQRYLDNRDGLFDDQRKNVNLFWSTTQVLLSALFARPPKVDVSRMHKDAQDDVSRVAGVILERILNRGLQDDGKFDREAFKQAIKDRLIVGLGQVWVRYEVEIEKQTIEPAIDPVTGAPMGEPIEAEVIKEESVPIDYVYWEDFDWSPCRTWEECRWVSRRTYLTKDQAVKRFGETIACQLNYTNKKKAESPIDVQSEAWSKACVYEIWCKDEKKVYWYSPGCPVILDVRDDPLQLEGFFPCPKPLAANLTSSRFMPKSDYAMAQDVYTQIDELNTRISWLVKACKVAGLYDQNTKGSVQRLFQEGSELSLIPVDNWAAFAEKGGVQGTISWVPIEQIANVIAQLRVELASAQQQLYEVLGISDIMRGASDPDETLGAQKLKAQFGSSRVQFTMSEIADWVAFACRIKAEIISRHCQPESIAKWSNIEATADAQLAPQAIQLIKSFEDFEWRVSIDPDTMAAIDYAQERESRTQMLDALGVFMERTMPLVQQAPQAAGVVLELVKWAIAGFKVGKEVESVIDQTMDAIKQGASQPQQPPIELELEKLRAQNRIDVEMIRGDTQRDIQASKHQIELLKLGMEQHLAQLNQQLQLISDTIAQQRDDVRAQLQQQQQQLQQQLQQAQQSQPPVPPVNIVGGSDMMALNEALAKLGSGIEELKNKKNPRRVRTPVRDANGDIVKVIEEDEEPLPLPQGMPLQ
jgi:hypothetical protein